MRKSVLLSFVLLLTSVLQVSGRSKSNLFKTEVAQSELVIEGKTDKEINRAVLAIISNQADWCKAFADENPMKNRGIFNYKGILNVVGIGVSEYVSKARATANRNCLAAMKDNDVSTVGVYSSYLKLTTKNGYCIFVIRRKPSTSTFRKEDFDITKDGGVDDIFGD